MEKYEKTLLVDASLDDMDTVVGCVEEVIEMYECPMKLSMKLAMCIEEVFVNVASYAYKDAPSDKEKKCQVKIMAYDFDEEIEKIPAEDRTVVFKVIVSDQGIPFNPLEKDDPDITLSADERPVGGLGIYIVKQTMDKVEYAYEKELKVSDNVVIKDGSNVLIMTKYW